MLGGHKDIYCTRILRARRIYIDPFLLLLEGRKKMWVKASKPVSQTKTISQCINAIIISRGTGQRGREDKGGGGSPYISVFT